MLSAGTQCDSMGAGAELCSHRRVDNTNRFKTSRCGIVEPQLEQQGHILCLRGACRCLLHEDLTLFIHFADFHDRRGSLGSLTASGKSPQAYPCRAPNTSAECTCVIHGDAQLDSPRGSDLSFCGGTEVCAGCALPRPAQLPGFADLICLCTFQQHPEVSPEPSLLSCPCATQGEHSDPW